MNSKINVLHITRSVEGGMLAHILKLCQDYNKEKFRISIAATDPAVFSRNLEREIKVIPCQIWSKLNISGDISAIIKLILIIKENNIRVVHTHGYKAGLVGRIAAIIAKVPVIIATFHNFIYDRNQKSVQLKIIKAIQRRLAARTDHIITVSKALAQDLMLNEQINSAKISTIYSNVNTAKMNQDLLVTYKNKLPNNFINIVTAARLIKEKGIHIFIKMAELIARKFPNVRFHIIGDGPEKHKLMELSSVLKVDQAVSFWGYVKDAAALFPYFDIIVIPSLSEGLSITAVEALYAKKPVVASKVGGLPEVIKDHITGLLFKKEDALDCARQIEKLLNNPALAARLGNEGYESVHSWVNSADFCRETENVYLYYLNKKGILNHSIPQK
jgi:glycosyltransferase involved in cell wall biosynthesis